MKKKEYSISRLVKSEDLNHHGTLFAGRMAEWFVEGCFIAAASHYGKPEDIVCIKVHGMKFRTPVKKGSIITLTTKLVYVGKTSMTAYGSVESNVDDDILIDGFITFVCVDEEGKKKPHNLVLPEPTTEEEKRLWETAKNLR